MWLFRSIAILMLAGPGFSYAGGTAFPTLKEAYEIKHVRLSDSGGRQDYFKVRLPYPSTKVLVHYQEVFSKWIECGYPGDWEALEDYSRKPPQQIHQLLRYWVSQDNKSYITLGIQYLSSQRGSKPENDVQHVVLARFPSQDSRSEVQEFGAKCHDAPNKSVQRTGPNGPSADLQR